ncbi:stonustoxin subunit alpha-like [Clarias gariepinus]|uniref:stonustoxin subunit alpha-like n=1 Tax=Clarias gariepinus TaxID=13013 RepID=UPI00234C0D8A|nr:stonustoxin subunit alpha-like [Clarias gariepinus]
MDSRCMELAALGRPLYPGMLYDCRTDSFIPGVTLWDKKALNNDLDVRQQPKTDLKFAASDTLSEKANLLDISASLKASFYGGLVEVGGSAKYLQDTKSSAQQCRVTMQYSQTTKFEQLTMKELGKITYTQVFDQKTATHVVTAVLYGAQAFMIFDYTSEDKKNKQAVEGNLHAVVKKMSIGGEGSVKMTEDEKKLATKISVIFHGDYKLKQNPTTYDEALEVYKTLPTLLEKQNYDGVPLRVWLYPLSLLNDNAAKLVREIEYDLVNETEKMLEELDEAERRCKDLYKNQTVDNFPAVKDRLAKFQQLHSNYKIVFQKNLSRVLPAIRSGATEDKVLGDLLNIHYTSPFTANNMNKWLEEITTELNILSSYTNGLENLTVVTSSESLNSILFDPEVDVVVCLSFTSLKYEDSYLEALENFLKSKEFSSLKVTQPWFTSPERMSQNLSLFTSFLKANKKKKGIKFIIGSISDSNNPGISIQLYQKGHKPQLKFQPVSKPSLPVVKTSDEKVILTLSKSPTGETVRFRVEYRMTPSTDSAADDANTWKVKYTPDAQSIFTLTEFEPEEQYLVRYRAVSDVGVSEASETVSFSFHGRLTVSQWNFSMPSLFNELRTKIMTSMGMSRWSVSTIKSELTNVVNHPSVPYTYKIPGGLRAGRALYFQGVVFATGQTIIFDALTSEGDIAFHFRIDLDKWTTCDSLRNGVWEKQEWPSVGQISKGSAFDIFIVTKTEGYEVYLNGKWSFLFKHRMQVEKVTALHIHEHVVMNTVGLVENWIKSTFAKELYPGNSHTKHSDIQSDVLHPVCNPNKSFLGSIPGNLRPGMALLFQGVVSSDYQRFEINFQTGKEYLHDIAFHFNPRMNSVVRNSCSNGTWDSNHIETPGGPFVKGGAFDIIMVIKPECYEVIVNGLEFCTFDHRIPVDKVTFLSIMGDVFMNTLRFIEVEDVNLKVIIPASI